MKSLRNKSLHQIEAVSEPPSIFEDVSRHFVMNLSEKRELQPVFTELRPIKDSAAALRAGHRSRLSICQTQPK